MSLRYLLPYVKMLPVLRAQEELAQADVAAVGAATMKRSDARQWSQRRRRAARAVRDQKRADAAKRATPEQEAAKLSPFGFEVKLIPAPAPKGPEQ